MEFIRLADKLLPALTTALNTFVNNSGFKKIADTFQGIEDFFERMGIVKTYAQATLMNIASAASQPLINQARLGNEIRKDFSKSVSVTTGPITVQANDPQEFVKRFDEALVKKYMNADLNFSQGQT